MAFTPPIFMKPTVNPQHVSVPIVSHHQAMLSANEVTKKSAYFANFIFRPQEQQLQFLGF
jgi:hypothetical protein